MRLLMYRSFPSCFVPQMTELFCLELKVGVGVILILERKNKRYLALYVSPSCAELDFVHLLKVSPSSPNLYTWVLFTDIHTCVWYSQGELSVASRFAP